MMQGLGTIDPQATTPTVPGAAALVTPPEKSGVPSAWMLPGAVTAPEAFLQLGGSILAGGLVGGLSDDDWRGAFIGAGSMAALVSGYSLIRAWTTADQSTKLVLGIGGTLSAAIAASVYLRRRKVRR